MLNTQFHKARKQGEARGCSEGGNAGKKTSGGGGLPLHWDMIGFPLCKNDNNNNKKVKMVLLNKLTEDLKQEGVLVLFGKATSGVDAVVVVGGLAADTGVWF